MRDWSSDVCSSDLLTNRRRKLDSLLVEPPQQAGRQQSLNRALRRRSGGSVAGATDRAGVGECLEEIPLAGVQSVERSRDLGLGHRLGRFEGAPLTPRNQDRKSVV